MSFVLRIMTLLIIAAAGFALPMTCAQSAVAAPVEAPVIAPSPVQPLAPPDGERMHAPHDQRAERMMLGHSPERLPFDCGETAPRATDHSATIDTQPYVAGYLDAAPRQDEAHSEQFGLPVTLIPIDQRAGPPDPPPPRWSA